MKPRDDQPNETSTVACTLPSPYVSYIPGVLSLAAAPAATLVNPLFFGLVGCLLAVICLLLAPPPRRGLGRVGLLAVVTGSFLGQFVLR